MTLVTKIEIDKDCYSSNANIKTVDTKNVPFVSNNAVNAFRNCTNLTSVYNLNPYITDLGSTFQDSKKVVNITFATPATPGALPPVRCYAMCYACNGIKKLPTGFTNLCPYDLGWAFGACYYMTDADFTGMNTVQLTSTYRTFYYSANVRNVTLHVDGAPSLNAKQMFYEARNLRALDMRINNCQSLDLTDCFVNCRNMYSLPNITNSVINAISANTFVNAGGGVVNWHNTRFSADVTSLYNVFHAIYYITDFSADFKNSYITNMAETYSGCTNLARINDLPGAVTDMTNTFRGCSNLTQIGGTANKVINLPDTVTTLCGTFCRCYNLTDLPFVGNNAVNLYNFAYECKSVTSYNHFVPATVTNMRETFCNCVNLTGNIYIKSNKISNAWSCFNGTALQKNVYIPFTYSNGVNTQTYNTFKAIYGGGANGVTLINYTEIY